MIYNIDLIRKQLLHTLHHRAEMEEALIQYGQVSGHIFLVKKNGKKIVKMITTYDVEALYERN